MALFRRRRHERQAGAAEWSATQAKALGMTAGEPGLRLYGYPGRVLFLEVKTGRRQAILFPGSLAHDRLAQLGTHGTGVIAPTD